MKPHTLDKITKSRGWLQAKYPGFHNLEPGERALLCMAYLADIVKPREVGTNKGPWVEAFLDSAGVGPGNPWCASAIHFALCVVEIAARPAGAAAVRNWRNWFEFRSRLRKQPKRGMIAMHNSGGGKGHIGIVVGAFGLWVRTIEGNTSSGETGSQRDGDGLYRRTRLKSYWSWGFAEL